MKHEAMVNRLIDLLRDPLMTSSENNEMFNGIKAQYGESLSRDIDEVMAANPDISSEEAFKKMEEAMAAIVKAAR